jgi:hypothetical protein
LEADVTVLPKLTEGQQVVGRVWWLEELEKPKCLGRSQEVLRRGWRRV